MSCLVFWSSSINELTERGEKRRIMLPTISFNTVYHFFLTGFPYLAREYFEDGDVDFVQLLFRCNCRVSDRGFVCGVTGDIVLENYGQLVCSKLFAFANKPAGGRNQNEKAISILD